MTLRTSALDAGHLTAQKAHQDVMKAKYLKDAAGTHALSGLDLQLSIAGGDGADNQKYPDVIEALPGAEMLFEYGEGKGDRKSVV